jgi:hypothetical protein
MCAVLPADSSGAGLAQHLGPLHGPILLDELGLLRAVWYSVENMGQLLGVALAFRAPVFSIALGLGRSITISSPWSICL